MNPQETNLGIVSDQPQNQHKISPFSLCSKCDVDAHTRAKAPVTLAEHDFLYSVLLPRGWSDRYKCKHCNCGADHGNVQVIMLPEGVSPTDYVEHMLAQRGIEVERP